MEGGVARRRVLRLCTRARITRPSIIIRNPSGLCGLCVFVLDICRIFLFALIRVIRGQLCSAGNTFPRIYANQRE